MAYGAGTLAARKLGARELVDPRPFAVQSIRETFTRYPHLGPVLPALGYNAEQVDALQQTIRRTECDAVVIATPVDLRRLMQISQPVCRVEYRYGERGTPTLADTVAAWIDALPQGRAAALASKPAAQ
jgi:predicted GTPase